MVKKIITLNENEYNNLVSKREELKNEVKEEYYAETRRPAIIGGFLMFFLGLWLYPEILKGYTTFPVLTTITNIFVIIFYCSSLIFSFLVIKKRLSKD